jgi:acyl-CoA thioesterase FadM
MPFEETWTIYAGDTDYSGRIYTPTVVDYVVRTLQEFRMTLGFPNERFQEGEYLPPARNVDIDYLGRIGVDDRLTVALEPSIGTTSVTYDVTATTENGRVVEGSVTTVFVDSDTEESIPVPEEFRTAVDEWH